MFNTQLTALVNDIPLSNPTYQSPNANVPGSYAITQATSNTPRVSRTKHRREMKQKVKLAK